jgi:hypothetical protein
VGVRSPAWVGGLNVPGYHWHFLSDDRTVGGKWCQENGENGVRSFFQGEMAGKWCPFIFPSGKMNCHCAKQSLGEEEKM